MIDYNNSDSLEEFIEFVDFSRVSKENLIQLNRLFPNCFEGLEWWLECRIFLESPFH